ncbi:uncharacterized protein LOC132308967 [Cornus florida]|uniref:uncharacterized protein LOC132308967 n=1 Tax=Cornus florida TaxID=4283 RepID=UPI00289B6BCC|nr:uncharacterized protein LOC132308967 [Cornus florida]
MAAFELLLSQARRHCFARTPSHFSLLLRTTNYSLTKSFLGFHRSLSSSSPPPPPPDSSSEPNSETRPHELTRTPPPVQAVSYPVKPKDPSPPQEEPPQSTAPHRTPQPADTISERPLNAQAPTWTREDIRYVKDVPSITPVSYPSRVAPLPEDRADVSAENEQREDRQEGNEQFERERKRIEADHRRIRPGHIVEEEKVPFPTLIKVEQRKGEKVIYDLKEAIRLVKANAKRNFNETVEAHVNLAPELRRTDLKLSGSVKLPHNLGKSVRVVVFAEGTAADEARAAGADIVGGPELIEEIKNGNVKVNFDKCIATPKIMPVVGKEISKILRRLTPNPRSGTVTTDVARVVREAKENIDLKKDPSAIVHVGLGKVSFSEEALRENVGAFVNALLLAKPVGLKKSSKYAGYVNSFHLCSTMGPAFPVSIQSLSIAADQYNKLQLR